ncbi:MAG: dephospho-CoA kinase [Sulfurospirillum sp.]
MIVLTGSIATGKSSTCKLLSESGYEIVDADLIAKELIDTKTIENLFGKSFIKDGDIDRVALGELIFNNLKEREKLNEYIHPLIRNEIYKRAKILEEKNSKYIVDIPLYFESGHYKSDLVCVVYCPKKEQLKRLAQRENLNKEEAEKRVKSQMDIEEKKRKADYVIDNSKDKENLLRQTNKFIRYLDANFKI